MRVYLIRHGKTQGNIEKRYIGSTDEPLCEIGIKELEKITPPPADIVITSALKRAKQTTEILYSRIDEEIAELNESDFGSFEGKSYEDLKNNSDYVKWIESSGEDIIPTLERKSHFSKRCISAFEEMIEKYKDYENIAFVIHGGTIMAIAEYILKGNFYDYQLKNGEYIELVI